MAQSTSIVRPLASQLALLTRPAPLEGEISGGGGGSGTTADAQRFELTGATAGGGALGQSFVEDATDVTITLTANTASDNPTLAAFWERPIIDVFGDPQTLELVDIYRGVLRLASLVPVTDMHVGLAVIAADNLRGFAVRLAAVAGDWQVQHATLNTGTWGAWVVATSDGETQAMYQVLAGRGNGTTQARYNGIALDALGQDQGGTTSTATTTGVNVGGSFTKVRLFAGWIAGAIGPTPASITLRTAYVMARVNDFPRVRSLFL